MEQGNTPWAVDEPSTQDKVNAIASTPAGVRQIKTSYVTAVAVQKPRNLAEVKQRFPKARLSHDQKACATVLKKVVGYIAAPIGAFRLPLDMRGTSFQRSVWEEVRKVRIGETSSYSRIAEAIGAPKAIRAVASSCSRCMFAFAVPCRRVLHKGGDARDANGRRRLRWVEYEARLLARRCK